MSRVSRLSNEGSRRPQPAPIRPTVLSYSCSQCHHLERNAQPQFEDNDVTKAQCVCPNCDFVAVRLGHRETFFSMASQRTDPDMRGYFTDRPQSSRPYVDPPGPLSMRAAVSNARSSMSNRDNRSPHDSRTRNESSSPEASVGTPNGHAWPPIAPANGSEGKSSLRRNVSRLLRPRGLRSMLQRLRSLTKKTKKPVASSSVPEMAEDRSNDNDDDGTINPDEQTISFNNETAEPDLLERRHPSLADTTPSSRDRRLSMRRQQLSDAAAARIQSMFPMEVPQHSLYGASRSVSMPSPTRVDGTDAPFRDERNLLSHARGGTDSVSTRTWPGDLQMSDLGSAHGSGSVVDLPLQQRELSPPPSTDRRPSDSTSVTLLDSQSQSSHRGSSSDRNRQSYDGISRSSRVRSSLSSEILANPVAQSHSVVPFQTWRSGRPDLVVGTEDEVLHNHVETHDDSDGGITPRAQQD